MVADISLCCHLNACSACALRGSAIKSGSSVEVVQWCECVLGSVQQAAKPAVLSQRSANTLHVNKPPPSTNDHKLAINNKNSTSN